jgi:hypothetical protein
MIYAPVRAAFNTSSSLVNVAVFAGGSVLGMIGGLLSTASSDFDTVIDVLCLSFFFFMGALFLGIGVQIILRKDDPDTRPTGTKAILVTVHLFVSLGANLFGFLCVLIAFMKFGRNIVGGIGIGLLGLIPLWVCALFFLEWKHGMLHEIIEDVEEERRVGGEAVADPSADPYANKDPTVTQESKLE